MKGFKNPLEVKSCFEADREKNEVGTQDTKPLESLLGIEPSALLSSLCYREVKQEGSCSFGASTCRFSHNIPGCVKENREMALNIVGRKNLCINEFFAEGSCRKGDECRFHHGILDEQRKDPKTIEIMKEKRSRMHQQKKKI